MSFWRQLTRGARVLAHREAADRDLADEIAHYVDEATDAFVAQGVPRADARRRARLEAGSALGTREQVRDGGWENRLATLAADARYGARRLRRDIGFTVVAASTLAIGIGATTAIFSAVNPILFDPLPYPQASRIVAISDVNDDQARVDITFGSFREILARSRSFAALAVARTWQPTIVGTAQAERLDGQRISASYFHVLGVAPTVGRDFTAEDDRVNGPGVVILSDGLWRRRFAADPAVLGRAIALDATSFTVIGIMPRGFENVMAPSAELWAPLQYDASVPFDGREWGHHLRMSGRLRPGVDLDHARVELQSIAATRQAEFSRAPWATMRNGLLVTSLQDDVTRGVRPALVAVLGAVLLLLAIACVNVTSLQLARGTERRGEFAMRAALGAGRGRLVQQLVTESVLLALGAGALGLFIADLGVRALLALGPSGLPRVDAIRVDATAFWFASVVAATVGIITGLVPALHVSRGNLVGALQRASARIGGGHQRTRRALVIAEIALALVLLVGAGLLLHSLSRLFSIAPGFVPSHVLTMQVQTAGQGLAKTEDTHRFFDAALDAVRAVPGVESAGFSSQLPLAGSRDMYGVHFETAPPGLADADRGAYRYAVTPGYLEAMGIPLRLGRPLDAHDAAGAPEAVLISESLAKSRFDGNAIGQRLRIGPATAPWRTVVGVVGDVRQESLALDLADAVYAPNDQWQQFTDRAMWLVVRTHGDAGALSTAVKSAVWSVDKDQPITRVATLETLVATSAAERRFALIVFEAFALVALVLATIGIYGVLSGSVTERTREIGVRTALGASRGDILGLVVRQGMTLTAAGVIVGLIGAAAASGTLVTLLFGVSRLDPMTYAGVVGLLAVVSALACSVPAWRAAHVDPAITLRAD